MKFINNDTGLGAIINVSLVERMAHIGTSKYPNEYGGILIGHYVENRTVVSIDEIMLPKKYKSTRALFERGSEGLRELLEDYYKREPQLIYVGEWHTHPDVSATPSQTDLHSMNEIADDSSVLITNPILLIFEIRKLNYNMQLYLLHQRRLLQYTLLDE